MIFREHVVERVACYTHSLVNDVSNSLDNSMDQICSKAKRNFSDSGIICKRDRIMQKKHWQRYNVLNLMGKKSKSRRKILFG